MGRGFANSPVDLVSIPGHVLLKTLKMIHPCLIISNIRYLSTVKWSNPGKGVAPFPTTRCSSYWKGSLLVALDYGRQLYFFLPCYLMRIDEVSTFHRSWTLSLIRRCHIYLKVYLTWSRWQVKKYHFWRKGGYMGECNVRTNRHKQNYNTEVLFFHWWKYIWYFRLYSSTL